MKIGVRFFAVLQELVGRSADTVELPQGARVQDLLFFYVREAPGLKAMLPSLAISVNCEYSTVERELREGDEVGFLPPVSGGAGEGDRVGEARGEVKIVRERIDTQSIAGQLKRPEDGAAVIFEGVVRNHTRGRRTLYLEYEAYEVMALKQLESLASEARLRFGVGGVSIIHRLGRLAIGETSVLIVVSVAHRETAFEACRWIIDTLKKTVPIWKKEFFEDGAMWADGDPFPEEIQRAGGTTGVRSAS